MIYKKLNLNLTDSLRLHYPVRYRNPLKTPVQLNVSDHEVEIVAHLSFAPKLLEPYVNAEPSKGEEKQHDPLVLLKDENFTFADAVCEGIEKNWHGNFSLPWYSHDSKNLFKVSIRIIREDKDQDQYEEGQKFVKIRFAPFFMHTSFVSSPAWRWVWGLFYCGSLESFTLNWSPSSPGTINMKKYKNLTRFEQVAAHEFGHVLGLGDAYDAHYRFFYQLPDVSSYMMCYNRKVQNEEIEMVLRSHLTRRMQYFPYKFIPSTFFKGLINLFKR